MREIASRSAHPSMRLNYDILLVVMSLLRRKKDILRLACTCRALYQAVIPYLLKGHVELKSQAHIVSFCHFMLRDRSRFRYLRSLSFGDGNDDDLNEILDEETERLVPTMFKHASNLEVLLLDCDRFVSTESFCRAIAELPSLSTFIVYLEDYECYRIFRGIKAPVKSVHIIPRDNSPPPDEQPDAIYVVEPMKDSLEILHVTHFDAVFSMDTQYPKLVELYINGGLLTEIRPLIHSFPNLRRLRIFLEESNMPWVHEDASLRQIIQHNILAQTHERWKTLSQVSSDTHALRMFRIHSKVDYLNIEGDELTGEDLDDLFDVLSETRPRRLTFRCHEFPRNIQRLDHVLSPVSDMLEALRLDFVVKGREAKEPGPIIKVLSKSFSRLSIRILCLGMDWLSQKKHFDSTELEALAYTIKSFIESLHYIGFKFSGRRIEDMWTNSDILEAGQRRLVKLPQDEVNRVLGEFFKDEFAYPPF